MRFPVMAAALLVSNVAFARQWVVDPTKVDDLVTQLSNARDGDILALDPGVHTLTQPITVNVNITITGLHTPREVDDSSVGDSSVLYFDVLADGWTGTDVGVIKVAAGKTLTFQDIEFREKELICTDGIDNDGNGLGDDADPACEAPSDTAAGGVGPPTLNPGQLRAFYLVGATTPTGPTATLNLVRTQLQGWSIGIKGGAIYASSRTNLNITDSLVLFNRGLLAPNAAGGGDGGQGSIYATTSANVTIRGTRFEKNAARYGGAVYIADGTHLLIQNSAFHVNTGEDGGAIFSENSYVDVSQTYFVSNGANLDAFGGNQLWLEYEGGAIYGEDSVISLTNNIFLQNEAKTWGAAIAAHRSLGGSNPPEIMNNTFVENRSGLEGGAECFFNGTDFIYRNNIAYGETTGVLGATNWILGQYPDAHYNNYPSLGGAIPVVFTAQLSVFNVDTSTNLFDDPLFVYYRPPGGATLQDHDEWRIWQFWLHPNSPLIDAGDPSILDVVGGPSDIGAYGGPGAAVRDDDLDGWVNIYDCNDQDATIKPYAQELCDDIDNDCNGAVDDLEHRWFADRDFDSYGDSSEYVDACPTDVLPSLGSSGRWVLVGGDCNPTNAQVSPGRAEFCDGIDNNCDGSIDNGLPTGTVWYVDNDHDGFGRISANGSVQGSCPPNTEYANWSPFNTDCKDTNADIHPLITSATRVHPPLADAAEEASELDRDAAFVGDGIDEDCDLVDLCYSDADDDKFGDRGVEGEPPPVIPDNNLSCRDRSLIYTAENSLDCDDADRTVNPEANEVTGDGLDQNCDGHDQCYVDEDGDGFGNDQVVLSAGAGCGEGDDPTADRTGDCDDSTLTGPASRPGAQEICDGQDNNCNGEIDEVSSPDATVWFLDADGDLWGDVKFQIKACGQPVGYVAQSGDCNDAENRTYPQNQEVCDGLDNNCVSGIDENAAIDVFTWYQDVDGDGYGNKNLVTQSCAAPTDGTWIKAGTPLDCDDASVDVGPCPDPICPNGAGCSQQGLSGMAPYGIPMAALALLRRRRRAAK